MRPTILLMTYTCHHVALTSTQVSTDFQRAMLATPPGEKLLIGRRLVGLSRTKLISRTFQVLEILETQFQDVPGGMGTLQ